MPIVIPRLVDAHGENVHRLVIISLTTIQAVVVNRGVPLMDGEDLVPKILERMQTSGQQRPAIYAETPQGIESYQIFQFGAHRIEEDMLFFAGRMAGQKHREYELL